MFYVITKSSLVEVNWKDQLKHAVIKGFKRVRLVTKNYGRFYCLMTTCFI